MGTDGPGLALVTGASRGIGASIARRLADDGFTVICGATRLDNLDGIVSEIGESPATGVAHPLEIRVDDEASVDDAFRRISEQFGAISLLVNNAGVTSVAPIHQMDVADFDRIIDVNLRGVFLCTKHVSQHMIAAGVPGSIINVGSIAGINAFPGRGAYCAAKAAVHHLTKVAAVDLAPFKIRVNSVAPGYVRTDLVTSLIGDGRLDEEALKGRVPMGKLGDGEDVAAAISWLAGPESSYVTGTTLTIDGGWVAYGHI